MEWQRSVKYDAYMGCDAVLIVWTALLPPVYSGRDGGGDHPSREDVQSVLSWLLTVAARAARCPGNDHLLHEHTYTKAHRRCTIHFMLISTLDIGMQIHL